MEQEKNIVQCYGRDCLKCQDPCQWYACGMNVIHEKKETLALANGKGNAFYLDGMREGGEEEAEYPPELLAALDASPEEMPADRQRMMDVINRIAFLHIEYPQIFDALLRRVYLRQNQSDIARSRGVTRAAVSKELRRGVANLMTRELGLRTPVAKREKLLELTPEEFAVYKIMFLDGCSVRSTAAQLGISKSKAARMGQVLRRKLGKNGTSSKRPGKKS